MSDNVYKSRDIWRAAFKSALPVMCGYVPLAMAFGLLMNYAGYGALDSGAMSLIVYAGSSQFMAARMLASGAGMLEIALAVFFLNARHMAYGLSLLDDYACAGRHKFMMMFELSDEAYALLSAHGAPKGMDVAEYNFRVQLLCQASWIFGSVLGGALGMVLPINTKGLDFSLTALFITILVDQLRSKENRLPALIGALCALIMRFVMHDNMMLGGMVLLLVILMLSRCGVEAHTGGKCA